MHPYATDSSQGRRAVTLLTVAAILMAWAFNRLLVWTRIGSPWWLDTPAVLGFFGILWTIYDQYAWRWRWRFVHLSDVPDLAGRWKGEVASSHGPTILPATLVIHQTATRVLVVLETENSRSASVMATVNCRPGQFQGLTYVYENKPRTLNAPSMTPHGGISHLRLENNGRRLVGDYEADHHRGTTGRITFERLP